MKFENSTPLHDLAPAIDPGVEKATGALFHRLHRVIIEVKASGGTCGYRKLNAISLVDLPAELRTSEQEDELNAAIMLVATSYVAESGESTRFRARYMSLSTSGDGEVRNYVRFKVLSEEEQSEEGRLDLGFRAPGGASGIEQVLPVIRWLAAMFEGRERMMIAYNEGLTDKLLESAAQAEPLLRTQGKMAKLYEQGLVMAFNGSAASGAMAGMQHVVPEQPHRESDGLGDVLKPGLEMAFSQFINRGKAPPPGAPGSTPGAAPSSDRASGAGSPGAAPSGTAGAGSVRFSSEPQASPKAEPKEKVNAEVVADPVDPIVRTIAMWLGSMDGSQMLALTESLKPEQRQCLQAARSAKTDDAAAKAVLGLQAELVKEGNWADLLGLLESQQQQVLLTIQAMAERHSEQ